MNLKEITLAVIEVAKDAGAFIQQEAGKVKQADIQFKKLMDSANDNLIFVQDFVLIRVK